MLRRAAVSIAALSALTVALVATSESPLGINLSGATVALDDHGLFELADDSDDTDDPVLVAAAWRVDLGTTVGTTRMAPYNWLRARLDGGPEVGLHLLVDDCDGNVLADTPELVPSPDVRQRPSIAVDRSLPHGLIMTQQIERTRVVPLAHRPRDPAQTPAAKRAPSVQDVRHQAPRQLQAFQHLSSTEVPPQHQ